MNLSLQSVDGSLNILNQSAPWQQNAFITVLRANKQKMYYICADGPSYRSSCEYLLIVRIYGKKMV